jgi:hypothetical protein
MPAIFPVASDVREQFWSPIVGVCFWIRAVDTANVLVPKTAVNEDRRSVFRQHNVRLAWQVLAMQPKSMAELCERFAHNQFRIGVARSNSRHVPTPSLYRELVGHIK